MNKLAAEKIASEYYNLGLYLALEKTASSLLNRVTAKRLAEELGKEIGAAGKLTSEAGVLGRLSEVIPGTQMNEARKILRAATNKANQQYAEQAHNLGFGLVRGRPLEESRLTDVVGKHLKEDLGRLRYDKAVDEGMIPSLPIPKMRAKTREALGYSGKLLSEPRLSDLKSLPEVLKDMPSEAEIINSLWGKDSPMYRRLYKTNHDPKALAKLLD